MFGVEIVGGAGILGVGTDVVALAPPPPPPLGSNLLEAILAILAADTIPAIPAYIAAVGEKDASRLGGKYFRPYNGDTEYGYDVAGYTYNIPAEANAISGTDVRNWLSSDNAEQLFLKAYPKFDAEIYKLITKDHYEINLTDK